MTFAELFLVFVSVFVAETAAVFTSFVFVDSVGLTVATIVTVAVAPFARDGIAIVCVLPDCVQVPTVVVHDTGIRPLGIVSIALTDCAAFGPALRIVSV